MVVVANIVMPDFPQGTAGVRELSVYIVFQHNTRLLGSREPLFVGLALWRDAVSRARSVGRPFVLIPGPEVQTPIEQFVDAVTPGLPCSDRPPLSRLCSARWSPRFEVLTTLLLPFSTQHFGMRGGCYLLGFVVLAVSGEGSRGRTQHEKEVRAVLALRATNVRGDAGTRQSVGQKGILTCRRSSGQWLRHQNDRVGQPQRGRAESPDPIGPRRPRPQLH